MTLSVPGVQAPEPASSSDGEAPRKVDPGYFSDVCEASEIDRFKHLTEQIYFGSKGTVPQALISLQNEFEATDDVLRLLYKNRPENKQDHRRLFTELLSGAQLLAGPMPNISGATSALQRLQQKILDEHARRVMNGYLGELAKVALPIAGVLYAIFSLTYIDMGMAVDLTDLRPYVAILATALIGMSASLAIRKPQFSFHELRNPSEDLLTPWTRTFVCAVSTIFFTLLCDTKAIGISLGAFSTQSLGTDVKSMLIFGFLCGLAYNSLVGVVHGYSQTAIDSVRKSPRRQ